ncbi:MAG: (2Fe-2S) ferredoxin domain-containing protein, partial [Clostridia bacterium]|nr:(2Fe-2S) ferredoxin domain-containing protein [Clostridia bacterium]
MAIKNRAELQAFRAKVRATYASQTEKIIVCAGTGCVAGGSLQVYARLKALMEARNISVAVELEDEPHDHSVGLKKSGCHGF